MITVLNPRREQLIVMLHGGGGNPSAVRAVVSAFAQAGYRAISLHWRLVSRADCVTAPTDADYNDCLEAVRASTLWDAPDGIVPQLQELLGLLAIVQPTAGWSDFITPQGPDWSRIILAGYSAGANQAAFATRALSPHGTILISAGADTGVRDEALAETAPLADWVTDLPENTHVVGLRNEFERFTYQRGWDAAGMPPDVATDIQSLTDPADFRGAHRLERTDRGGTPDEAHRSTILSDIKPAHMHLACTAGG